MSVKRVYSCNICRTEKPIEQLYGIYFVTNNRFEFRHVSDCENHICKPCVESIKGIKEIWNGN